MENMPVDLMEFLQWIVYGGGGAIAISWILEQLNWYQEKPANQKKNIFFGFVSVFTILVYAVLNYVPASTLEAIAPYFGIVALAFLNTYIGTGYHRASKPSPKIEDGK